MINKLQLRKHLGDIERPLHPGYSWCYRCGRPWSTCQSHTTYFSETEGCFPLCQDCWEELSPEERVPYYEQLIAEWENQGAQQYCKLPWFLYKQQIISSVLSEGRRA